MSKIIELIKSRGWKFWLTLLVVIVLGAIDAVNKYYGTDFHVPEWIWPILAAFGIFVPPRKAPPSGPTPGNNGQPISGS